MELDNIKVLANNLSNTTMEAREIIKHHKNSEIEDIQNEYPEIFPVDLLHATNSCFGAHSVCYLFAYSSVLAMRNFPSPFPLCSG
jgi:hypothetical protein